MLSKLKLFILIFLPSVLVLTSSLAIINKNNQKQAEEQFKTFLTGEWQIVSQLDDENIQKLSRLNTNLRITVIKPDGTVKTDTKALTTEPHADREEIRSAFADTPHLSVRYSYTTKSHTVYYAEKLPDGNVLRVAYPAEYYDNQKSAVIKHAMTNIIILIIMVGIFAYFISAKFANTMTELGTAVVKAKDGAIDLPSFENKEIDSALSSLSETTRKLRETHKQSLDLAEQLEYILNNIAEGVILINNDKIVYKNQRAEEILDFKLPAYIRDINDRRIIDVFSMFNRTLPPKIEHNNRYIDISMLENSTKLIILRDISDETLYRHYKADLVGNISHELKTPLSLIIVAAETIQDNKNIPAEYMDKFLKTIQKNAERMNILFDDLIDLARLEHTDSASLSEPTNLGEIINEIKGFNPERVYFNYPECSINIHSAHVLSVINNLVNNAVKYTTGTINVNITRKNNIVKIEVADEGPAINKNDRKRIFERFYTISKSRSRDNGGSGLGLAIVKHIARIYNGTAYLDENSSGGNTFIIELVEK